MKTLIAILTSATVLSLSAPVASAHGGWSGAGPFIAGAAVGTVVGAAVASSVQPPPPVVYSPAPAVVYSTPGPAVTYATPAPVYVQSAPVVVYSAPVYRPYPYYCAPVVNFRFGWGGGYYHHHHH